MEEKNIAEIVIGFFRACNLVVPQSFRLTWNMKKILDSENELGLINSINEHSNISNAPQLSSSFDFDFSLTQNNSDYQVFGTDHGACDFATSKLDFKVALLEVITGKFLINIAKNEHCFLQALSKIIEFESLFENGIVVSLETTIQFRNICIELAGGQEYAKFYRFTIVSEADNPNEDFILP